MTKSRWKTCGSYSVAIFAVVIACGFIGCKKQTAEDHYQTGVAASTTQQFEDAKREFQTIIDQFPDSPRVKEAKEGLVLMDRKEAEARLAHYKKALVTAIESDSPLKTLFQGSHSNVSDALDKNYFVKVIPKVGGGGIPVWHYNDAPLSTWAQADSSSEGIFDILIQIGNPQQQASYTVDIRNGAVQEHFNNFSAYFR